MLVRLNLLIKSLLDKSLLGQLFISSMVQYISHLVVIICESLLFSNQGLEVVRAFLKSSLLGKFAILMVSFQLSLGVFLTQLSVFHVHYCLEIVRVVLVGVAKR